MNSAKYIFTLVGFLGSLSSLCAADDAATIVDKAIKAQGGLETLSKLKAEQWKAKGYMKMNDMKMEYDAAYFFQFPNQLRFNFTMDIGGQKVEISAATDGKVSWEAAMGMVREMEAKKAEEFRRNCYAMSITHLTPLKEKDVTLTVTGETKIDGKAAQGLKVSKKGQRDVLIYFDKESYLPVKTEYSVWDEFSDKEVKQEVFFKGWNEKNGTKYFEKLEIHREGKLFIEETLSDWKAVESLDAKLFAKPAAK